MSHMGETRNHNDIIIDDIFAFQVAMDIMRNDKDQEPQTVDECQKRNDWPKLMVETLEKKEKNKTLVIKNYIYNWNIQTHKWKI